MDASYERNKVRRVTSVMKNKMTKDEDDKEQNGNAKTYLNVD